MHVVNYTPNLPHRTDALVEKCMDEVYALTRYREDSELTGSVSDVLSMIDEHLSRFPIGITPDTWRQFLRPQIEAALSSDQNERVP